jgi:hypothetical protein
MVRVLLRGVRHVAVRVLAGLIGAAVFFMSMNLIDTSDGRNATRGV